MSKTPRTDKEAFDITTGKPDIGGVVMSDFARELERENSALRQQAEFGANMLVKAAEQKQRADKIEAENAALRALLVRIRNEKDLLKVRPGAQDQYAGMPPVYRLIDAALAKTP